MARTDRRGRDLKTFLIAEVVGTHITVEQLRQAVGVKRGAWYGNGKRGRFEADDFPNPYELHRLAEHFRLGDDGYVNLLVEFGWISPNVNRPGFTNGRATVALVQPMEPSSSPEHKAGHEHKASKRELRAQLRSQRETSDDTEQELRAQLRSQRETSDDTEQELRAQLREITTPEEQADDEVSAQRSRHD